SSGTWLVLLSTRDYNPAAPRVVQWGVNGDVPIPAVDFDKDGKNDPAIWRPSEGKWYVLYSTTQYSTWQSFQWGAAGDVPVPNDFDGDGATDVAIWRPSTGTWHILLSSAQYSIAAARSYQWGAPTDIPITHR